MNIFNNQLVFGDGETMREKAVKGLPGDCPFVRNIDTQIPPQKVSVQEFEQSCEHTTRTFEGWEIRCLDCGEIVDWASWKPDTAATKPK